LGCLGAYGSLIGFPTLLLGPFDNKYEPLIFIFKVDGILSNNFVGEFLWLDKILGFEYNNKQIEFNLLQNYNLHMKREGNYWAI
jgi:hypothetical protein